MKSILVCLCLLFSPLAAFGQAGPVSIDRAEELGQLLYNYDQAAWHSTDRLFEEVDQKTLAASLKGWVTIPDGKSVKVIYVGETDGRDVALYEMRVKGSKVKSYTALTPPRPLTSQEAALHRATKSVIAHGIQPCREFLPMNTVVFPLPDDPEEKLYAYFLASTKDAGKVPMGKHFRFTLDRTGSKVLSERSFTNSCIALDRPQSQNGAKVVGLMISHITANYPEEHHVFANLTQGVDVYVATPETDDLWKVSRGKIKAVNTKN